MDEPLEPGRSSRRTVLVALIVTVVTGLSGLLLWVTLAGEEGRKLVSDVGAGNAPRAPDFELEVIWSRADDWPPSLVRALDDGALSLEEVRGYPAVVNFWASWCVPCREEAPILASSARAHRGGVVFIGIDVQDLSRDAIAWLRELNVPFPSLRDGTNETYEAYGLTGLPETYWLDTDGRVVAHWAGALSAERLERGIATAIESR